MMQSGFLVKQVTDDQTNRLKDQQKWIRRTLPSSSCWGSKKKKEEWIAIVDNRKNLMTAESQA